MSNKDLGIPDLDIGRIGVFKKVPLFLKKLLNFELMPSCRRISKQFNRINVRGQIPNVRNYF